MSDKFTGGLVERLYEHTQVHQSTNLEKGAGVPIAPLHTRLQKLLDTIPDSVQRQGLSLLDLQACLRGRKGGLPHIGEMGAAMRKLGWQRHRAWSDENTAFSSRWHPPKRG